MGWRFFERFQKCVKGLRGQHVHFVNDVDFVTRFHRRVAHPLYQLADIANARARRRIHFENIRMPTFCDRAAMCPLNRHVN